MKTIQILKQILLFCASACTANASISVSSQGGKIIDRVICKSDSTQSYALYIPMKGNKNSLPVIYFFDAHADGTLPLRKYRSLAEEYGFILVGSNNSKNENDWPTTQIIWRHLFDETENHLKINSNRIYTCGFSGGAKVASFIALNYPIVQGVIACGAALPDGVPVGDFKFSFTTIAGHGDMNLTDLETICNDLDNTKTRHHMILFDGKHEWPPEYSMSVAFTGFQLDAMQRGLIPRDITLITHYFVKSEKRLATYLQTSQLVKAEQECRLSISLLDSLDDERIGRFKNKLAKLIGNPLFQKQRQIVNNLLLREQNIKAEYMQHFQGSDKSYWVNAIGDLQKKANVQSDETGMYQRLLAYLSLAFYSFANRLIKGNENYGAARFVELYKLADPTNSEAWYFSAILHARDNKAQFAENDLLKAAEFGFKDEKRMVQQTEFQKLGSRISVSKIESKMHNP